MRSGCGILPTDPDGHVVAAALRYPGIMVGERGERGGERERERARVDKGEVEREGGKERGKRRG